MKRLVRILVVLVLLYAGLVAFVAARQDRYFYQPAKVPESDLLEIGIGAGLQPLRNPQGDVVAWHLPNSSATRRVLVFHGGSGHALNRIFYATGFHRHGWDVCLFEYPGFGARPGVPGKETFISAGLEFARERASADPRPLFLFGESMGSGTVCAVAGTLGKQIAGVGLIVPYARLLEVAQWHLPCVPMALVLRDQYDNIAALQGYDGPLTVLIAERDEVVSPDQGRKLHASYSGPKHLITLRDCTHAGFPTAPGADWWNELSRSLQR